MKRKKTKSRAEIKKSFKQLGKKSVIIGAVGEHAPRVYQNGNASKTIPNHVLLAIHELGLGNNPARAPIRKTFRDKKNIEELKRTIQLLIKNNLNPATGAVNVDAVMEAVALKIRAMVKATILDGLDPDIAPETKENRVMDSADVPLVDTRQLLNSIETAVGE